MKLIKMFAIGFAAGLILYMAYVYIKLQWFLNTFTYGLRITGFNTASFKNLTQLGTNNAWIEISYQIILNNDSDFSLHIDRLEIDILHDGQKVGESVHAEGFEIYKKEQTIIEGKGKGYLNMSMGNMLLNGYLKDKLPFEYRIKAKVKGIFIPLNYRGKYVYDKNAPEEASNEPSQLQSVQIGQITL